jgi:hypothetical protein
VSLSKEPAFSLLHNDFVCGYKDISNEPYAGNSGAHSTNANAVETTNGAGSHNIQMFIMDADGTVLHVLPGYWNPSDLAGELRLAQQLETVWHNQNISLVQKKEQFSRMQIDHFKHHSKELVARSHMQGFDRSHELARKGFSDTLRMAPGAISAQEGGDDLVKTTDEIMHERMSKRPFVSYAKFDTAQFADYGTHFYDKHEENLDETGKNINPEAKVVTMQEVNHKQRAWQGQTYGGGSGGRVPHMQVKSYGVLRVSPAPQASPAPQVTPAAQQ